MTIIEALENVLVMLEAGGLTSGDIHDDLALAAQRLRSKFPQAAMEEL